MNARPWRTCTVAGLVFCAVNSRAMRRCGLVVPLVLVTLTAVGCGSDRASSHANDPWSEIEPGWTKLPTPPALRTEVATVWTGSELLLWGGCGEWIGWCHTPTSQGFAFDPVTQRWRTLPSAPRPRAGAKAVWTGREAIFVDFGIEGLTNQPGVRPQAYDPVENSWRVLPPPPLSLGYRSEIRDGVQVWTSSELILWGGGGPRGPAPRSGAAYDPDTNTWRRIAEAPLGLNRASGVWTGEEMVVFGSLLDGNNRATTTTSIGAAYDPVTDRWRRLAPSRLSPQATSAVMAGEHMLAWDYELRSQEYDSESDYWDRPQPVGLDFAECGPESAALPDHVFGLLCGQTALYNIRTGAWESILDGPLGEQVRIGRDRLPDQAWNVVALESAGPVVTLALRRAYDGKAQGCEDCPRSPESFWVYRP